MAEKKSSSKQASSKQSSSKPATAAKESPPDKTQDKSKAIPVQPPKKKSGCLRYLIYFSLFLIIIAGIAGGAIYAAHYLGFIDLIALKDEVGQKYELQKYPVVGQYFPSVETNFEPVPLKEDDKPPADSGEKPPDGKDAPQVAPTPAVPGTQSNTITPADVAREEERNQAEFAKRVSRLARLYGEMKPASAAAVMTELDDETVLAIFSKMEDDQVAKILSVFEAERAARLTEDMLRGRSF